MPPFDTLFRVVEFIILVGLAVVGIGRWLERRERADTDSSALAKRIDKLEEAFVTRREYDQFCEAIDDRRTERREEMNRIYNRLSRLERGR